MRNRLPEFANNSTTHLPQSYALEKLRYNHTHLLSSSLEEIFYQKNLTSNISTITRLGHGVGHYSVTITKSGLNNPTEADILWSLIVKGVKFMGIPKDRHKKISKISNEGSVR